jgi:hypothetical protein
VERKESLDNHVEEANSLIENQIDRAGTKMLKSK